MNSSVKFMLTTTGYSMIIFCACLIILLLINDGKNFIDVSLGYTISLLIFAFGFIATNWAINRSLNVLLSVTLGGMFFRFILIGIILILFIRYTNINMRFFVVSFFVFYVTCQIFEIRFIHSNMLKHKKRLK